MAIVPQSYKEPDPNAPVPQAMDINIPDAPKPTNSYTAPSGALVTKMEDGSVEIDFNPKKEVSQDPKDFDANLAESIDDHDLAKLANDLFEGVEQDINSRSDWEGSYTKAIDLLGLKMMPAGGIIGESVSNVYHPLLLEACIRYQAAAGGEMLPAAGPVKVYDDETGDQKSEDSDALEKDFNHYLTAVDEGYYPDFDQMLFSQGLSGIGVRKVYRCPLKNRPISESIPPQDFIVSNNATSLSNAGRKTHRIRMRQSVMLRMQFIGAYLDTDLTLPTAQPAIVDDKIKNVEGINSAPSNIPEDTEHLLYETYADLIIPGDEDKNGLTKPYRVTMEVNSKKIIEIRRNYKNGDENYTERERFVVYPLVPGLGFYPYGYAHILGNTSRALTSIERQLLDAGQFKNFPGFLLAKTGARQRTNQIKIMPGAGQEIDTGGQPIQNVAMPLPYGEPSGVLASLAEAIAGDARKLAGSAELPIAEGNAEVPVGTVLAMIEQATKVMGAVHKRNHRSQRKEFEILRDLFKEDPSALSRYARTPKRQWATAEQLSDQRLVPASDPNVPSHIHRIMQTTGLVQMAAQAPPGTFNMRLIYKTALLALGYTNVDELLPLPPPPGTVQPPGPPNPLDVIKATAESRKVEQDRELQQDLVRGKLKSSQQQMDIAEKERERKSREHIAQLSFNKDMAKIAADHVAGQAVHTQKIMDHHKNLIDINTPEPQDGIAKKKKPKPKGKK